jgi:branched-chain amino acid transport system permease protein
MHEIKNNRMLQIVMFLIAMILVGALAYLFEYTVDPYYMQICYFIGINIIMALGLNLIAGVTGQLSLGQSAFMSIGAYLSAISTTTLHMPFLLSIVIAGLFAAVVAIVIGLPILRLEGDYLAIATIGFAEIVRVLMTNIKATGGAIGFMGIKKFATFPTLAIIVFLTIAVMVFIEKSKEGRAMLAIREDEIAAEAMGINVTLYKVKAFAIGSFFAGIAGALYAHTVTFIQPKDFDFDKSVESLNMLVLGGLGSIPGSILGSVILTTIPEVLRFMANYRMLLYGALLVVMMIFRPNGLIGGVNFRVFVKKKILKGLK